MLGIKKCDVKFLFILHGTGELEPEVIFHKLRRCENWLGFERLFDELDCAIDCTLLMGGEFGGHSLPCGGKTSVLRKSVTKRARNFYSFNGTHCV